MLARSRCVMSEERGLAFHGRFVGSAGQVKMKTAVAQMFQQRAGPVDQKLLGPDRAALEPGRAGADVLLQPPQVFVLVPERLARLAASLLDPLGKLDHLVDRLLAVQAHDVVEHQLPDLVVRLAGKARQGFDEHRHHDLGPSLADQRKRAVEVEEHVADLGARLERGGQLDAAPARGARDGLGWAAHDQARPAIAAARMPVSTSHRRERDTWNHQERCIILQSLL